MANTETTFADRLARGRLMQTTAVGFTVAFAPPDATLANGPVETFLESVKTANDTANTKAAESTAAVAGHAVKMEAIILCEAAASHPKRCRAEACHRPPKRRRLSASPLP